MINSKHTMLTVYQKGNPFLETGTLYQSISNLNMYRATINMNLIIEFPYKQRCVMMIIFNTGKIYKDIYPEKSD